MTETRGQWRVGATFNPSASSLVDEIKQTAAKLIDLIDQIDFGAHRPDGMEPETASERARLKALAQTHVETAAMFAVKAVTKPNRGGV